MKRNILHVNGADHSRLRSLVNPALSPRAVERYRPAMRGFLEDLLARATVALTRGRARLRLGAPHSTASSCEFVEAFAKPYPSQTIASVMGAPLADAPRLHHWSNWIQRQFDAASMASEREGIERAVEEFYAYAEALVQRAPGGPGRRPDLDADRGRGGRRAAVRRRVHQPRVQRAGGRRRHDPEPARARGQAAGRTPGAVGAAGRPSPQLARAAVEEALRYEPITPFTARIVDGGDHLPRRDVPGGDDRDGVRVHGQPRPGRGRATAGRARTLRHHGRPRRRARADVRRGRALLPGREPGARGAARRRWRSWRSGARAWSSTASRSTRASPASTACRGCRSASRRERSFEGRHVRASLLQRRRHRSPQLRAAMARKVEQFGGGP